MESRAITQAVKKNGNEGKTMFEDKKITIEKVKDLQKIKQIQVIILYYKPQMIQ